jgi:hypothetical protein
VIDIGEAASININLDYINVIKSGPSLDYWCIVKIAGLSGDFRGNLCHIWGADNCERFEPALGLEVPKG